MRQPWKRQSPECIDSTGLKLFGQGEWDEEKHGGRVGTEGCLSQGIRLCGLRRSRYVGLAKTLLQNVATAAALNVARLDAWLRGRPRAAMRTSRFVQLMAA